MSSLASHLFIQNNSFVGVMKTSIIKEFHDVFMRVEFFKILSPEKHLIDMVAKSCWENHTNADALKLVSTEMIYAKNLNYNESERFKNYLFFSTKSDVDPQASWIISFNFDNDIHHFKVRMKTFEVLRLYTQVNSFYSSYFVFAAINKTSDSSEKIKQEQVIEEKKVTEYIPQVEAPIIQNEVVPDQIDIIKERTELDDIFELCLNSPLKSCLIHYVFNYFRYFDNNHCKIEVYAPQNGNKQVRYTIPLVLPSDFTIDENYFTSLILSNSNISFDNIKYVIKKILNNLLNNHNKYENKPIHIMMICCLLFIYLLKFLQASNKDSFRNFFSSFIYDPNMQQQMFEKLITAYFPEFTKRIFFIVNHSNIAEIDSTSESYNDLIRKVSESYKHLIPISQEKFADTVLSKISENKQEDIFPNDFILSSKKILDIIRIMENGNGNQIKKNSVLFETEQYLNPIFIPEADYLNYKLISNGNNHGEKIISKAYYYLVNFIKNPTSLLLINDKEIPKEVLNSFEVLSTKVLNSNIISKENCSTLNFYKLLLEKLPNAKMFKHNILMYMVYQILIPFHYDIYGTSQFEDCLL